MKTTCAFSKKTVLIALVGMLAVASVAMAADAPAAGPGAPNAEKLGWRLGSQAYTFRDFSFFEAVDKNVALGLKVIEAYPGQKLSPEKPDVKFDHEMSEETMAAVKAKLASAGVTLVNYGVVGIPNDEAKARIVFDFAKKMGIETIVSEPDAETFALLDKLTEEYKINVALHNHPKSPFTKYWDYKTVLKNCEGHSKRIGACADTGHWMRSGINPLEAIKALEGRIISFHFKDLNEFGKNTPKVIDVPWGTGKADVKALLTEIKRQGLKGVFSIEYENNTPELMANMTQCVAFFDKTATELSK